VTLKIETASDGETAILRLLGRVEAEYLDHSRRKFGGTGCGSSLTWTT